MKFQSAASYDFHPFICQRYPQGSPTSAPEPPIDGGCPDYWYPYKNRCYRFFATRFDEIEKRLSWEEAENKCKEESIFATLAVLPNLEYDLFVFSHMSGLSTITDTWNFLLKVIMTIFGSVVILKTTNGFGRTGVHWFIPIGEILTVQNASTKKNVVC